MTLYAKIKLIYPDLDDKNFPDIICLRNDSDGEGDYIFEWNHPTLTKPTQEQLNLVV
jgi:hypothetical protein